MFHDTWMRSTQTVVAFIRKNRPEYRELESSVENMAAFQKIGKDKRSCDHFIEFYTSPV